MRRNSINKDNKDDEKKILIWLNGKRADNTFEVTINKYTNSINRLKDVILSHLDISRIANDKVIIFNYKGLEIDEVDIPYLTNKQVLYVSLDGGNFNVLNYVYEYEFVKWIKSGGYGKVYLAKHNLLKDYLVAIKKIDISDLNTDELFSISREALYLQSFTHRNIIKYINSYIYDSNFFTVMEYAKGGELVNYIQEKKVIDEIECKRVFKQLHDAVKYIHSRNVIHRDLKPNNILFLDINRENLVLIDFGISGYNSGNVKETIKAGTTKFMPPELASGLTYSSSPKFDVWALGIILYLLLFGQFPFEANKDSDISNKIIREPHRFPSNITISRAGYNLLNGLLEKNAQFRIEINDPIFEEWFNDTNCSDKPLIKEDIRKNTHNSDNEDDGNGYINSQGNYVNGSNGGGINNLNLYMNMANMNLGNNKDKMNNNLNNMNNKDKINKMTNPNKQSQVRGKQIIINSNNNNINSLRSSYNNGSISNGNGKNSFGLGRSSSIGIESRIRNAGQYSIQLKKSSAITSPGNLLLNSSYNIRNNLMSPVKSQSNKINPYVSYNNANMVGSNNNSGKKVYSNAVKPKTLTNNAYKIERKVDKFENVLSQHSTLKGKTPLFK